MNLKQWRESCNGREIVNWFVKGDHYKVGLDNGGTVIQIMNDLGFRNPKNDYMVEVMAKIHLRNQFNQARLMLERDGFILSSKKFKKGTPSIYFIIDNISEERTDRHYSLKRRAEGAFDRLRTDKLTLLQLMDKVKDHKTKEAFKKAYASKANLSVSLLANGKKKELK